MESKRILEVCCGDIDSVVAANDGGASRIELCSALADGGVTPSYGLIKKACEISRIPVNVLIRVRGGDFVYTSDEVDIMVDDIIAAKRLGANAVVIGALTIDGDVDVAACRRMMNAAKGMEVTFHRAFDLCRDPQQALSDVISLGVNRILTSGLSQTALEGVETLKVLADNSRGKLVILAGAGVTPENAREIMDKSGVDEIHASARSLFASPMRYRREGVSMGTPGADEYSRKISDSKVVRKIVDSINR